MSVKLRSGPVVGVVERLYLVHWPFFFFQAEDGIRDVAVTGVQTCALPICSPGGPCAARWHGAGTAPGPYCPAASDHARAPRRNRDTARAMRRTDTAARRHGADRKSVV